MPKDASAESPDYGRWSEKGLPHKGWNHLYVDDLGSVEGACEMCGKEIRYVHYIDHEDFADPLGVGFVCAAHLTEDSETPREREKVLRSRTGKLARLSKKEWSPSPKGITLKHRGYRFVVYRHGKEPRPDWWGVVVSGQEGEKEHKWFGPHIYRSQERAKLACFEHYLDRLGARNT